jgi:hypothetical protein
MTETMRRATLDWLDRRSPAPPFELERRLLRAIERLPAPAETVPLTLAAAALCCLRDAAKAGDNRRSANDLLAGDALLTYACEAAAEDGLEALEQLTREVDFPRFEALLREVGG